jgi:hypothetical protein
MMKQKESLKMTLSLERFRMLDLTRLVPMLGIIAPEQVEHRRQSAEAGRPGDPSLAGQRRGCFLGSFRLGVYQRLGADYEPLSKINPRLIYATIRGYGFGNSFTEWPGNERNAQGMSEVSALMTGKDGEPADVRSAQDPVSARETLSSR